MRSLAAFLLALTLAGCGHAAVPSTVKPAAAKPRLAAAAGAPRFIAQNATYRVDPRVAIQLDRLDADIAQQADGPFVPEAKDGYGIRVHHAQASIAAASLEALVGTYVFGDEGAPVKDVKVSFKGDKLVMAGKIKKVLWVPFTCEGGVAALPDGKIRFTPTNVSAAGVRVDGLMQLVGLEIARVFELRKDKGITIQGNDFILDVAGMIPPPRMLGAVTHAAIANGSLALTLGDPTSRPLPALPVPTARNYLAIWGGNLRLGTATLADVKVQVCDGDPTDPLAFALDHFSDALDAGVVTLGKDGRTTAIIPDLRVYDAPLAHFATPIALPGQAPAGTLR